MKASLVNITPDFAAFLLQRNTGNRPINWAHVYKISRDMMNGRWKLNGDTICYNNDKIIDGQHRLEAIVLSGVSVQAYVIEGLPSDVFDTKDCGRRRSAGDTLGILGEKNTARLAACLVCIDRYYTGKAETESTRYSNSEVEELLLKYPQSRNSLQTNVNSKGLIKPSVIDACHYIFSRKDKKLADEFVDKIIYGTDLSKGNPWYYLRERLLANSHSKSKLSGSYIMAICIKAFNYARSGIECKQLKYIQGETFPQAQ